MIKALFTLLKVKIFFATVNKYRGWKAQRALVAYTKTLSPKNREFAEQLRKRLDRATPSQAAGILLHEAREVGISQMRLTEKIDRVITGVQNDR